MFNKKTSKGTENSSITRVRPIFQALFKLDITGKKWLPEIIQMANAGDQLKVDTNNINILPELLNKRTYKDRILQLYDIDSLQLENCFEYSTPPPQKFLSWLIQNPDKLSYEQVRFEDFSDETREMRENLFSYNGREKQAETQKKALAELADVKNAGSARRWWAFEGFTEVDCYLETENLVLLVEGKRNEPLSSTTMWYPKRNQIVRNLEVAQEIGRRKNKEYAVLLASEKPVEFDFEEDIKTGLPHFNKEENDEIRNHYLGNIYWEDIWAITGRSKEEMPDKTTDIVRTLKKFN